MYHTVETTCLNTQVLFYIDVPVYKWWLCFLTLGSVTWWTSRPRIWPTRTCTITATPRTYRNSAKPTSTVSILAELLVNHCQPLQHVQCQECVVVYQRSSDWKFSKSKNRLRFDIESMATAILVDVKYWRRPPQLCCVCVVLCKVYIIFINICL